MTDARIVKLADILVNYSLRVAPGEKILISGSTEAAPLIKEVYKAVLKAGGHPMTDVHLPGTLGLLLKEGTEEQVGFAGWTELMYYYLDGYVNILSDTNTKELTNVPSSRMRIRSKSRRPALDRLMRGEAKWVLTKFPTAAFAQDAEMSLKEFEDFVYGAAIADYAEMERSMLAAAEKFDAASKVRIVGTNGTDITVDIEGRKAIIAAGKNNVPDGEFYYTPNFRKTEGTIYFEWPTVFRGREISGIRLTFRAGKVIEASAEKGQAFLEEALDTDEGARYLGELGIGANFGITQPTKDILFDEKIGGSVHLALGQAYEQGGPDGNKSALHWDIVKGLVDGGELYLDGVLVQKNGKWVF
ncbi:aminopeptidase [Paenibacillus thermotolerans]|uniref:aminopeptidase n=1 Tax=Paenibacillus thermotolerans TaxID=3027807 RepID=UPI0023679284|nr:MULTISPECIES: aminopeptidase [unclassified Paenibacillus]